MKLHSIFSTLVVAIAMIGCGSNQSQQSHDDNDETLQITSYSDQYELFTELHPLVVGHESELLAHFTQLSDFKPLTQGSVEVSLVIDAETVTQRLDKPTKAGIYKLALTPTLAGSGTLIFDVSSPHGSTQIVVPNVIVYDNEQAAQHAAAESHISSAGGIVMTKEQSWKLDFATEEARKEHFGQVIAVTAQIQPSQADERIVTAKTSGFVIFSNQNLVQGMAVASGESLFGVDASSMADNNLSLKFQEAASEYARAKSDYERKSELVKDKIVSQEEYQRAKAQFQNAQAGYDILRKSFSAGKQSARGPISGFVKQIFVRNGEYVEAGQSVMVISQNRDLIIKADVQLRYYPLLASITDANIRVLNSDLTYSLKELDGRMISYGKSADATSPLIPVIFQVKNSVDLVPGSFVEMYIKTQTSYLSVTIPKGAIIEQMGNYFVFVQLTPELFEKRAVKIGSSDGLRVEIIDGLRMGERVVSRGAIMVKLQESAGTLDAHSGHVH